MPHLLHADGQLQPGLLDADELRSRKTVSAMHQERKASGGQGARLTQTGRAPHQCGRKAGLMKSRPAVVAIPRHGAAASVENKEDLVV